MKEGAEGGGRCRERSGRVKAEGKAPLTRDTSAKVARGSVKTTYLMHSLKLFALYDVNTPPPTLALQAVSYVINTHPCSQSAFLVHGVLI